MSNARSFIAKVSIAKASAVAGICTAALMIAGAASAQTIPTHSELSNRLFGVTESPSAAAIDTPEVETAPALDPICLTAAGDDSPLCNIGVGLNTNERIIGYARNNNVATTATASAAVAAAPARVVRRAANRVTAPRTAISRSTISTAAAESCSLSDASAENAANLCITFAFGSSDLTPHARLILDQLKESLVRHLGNQRLLIEGFTDSVGSQTYNHELSVQRARAVYDYLVTQGIPAERLAYEGHGFARPIEGYASTDPTNRRVEARAIS